MHGHAIKMIGIKDFVASLKPNMKFDFNDKGDFVKLSNYIQN